MEPIPLVPAVFSRTCPDVVHLIREEFQFFINKKFPLNIADNLTSFEGNKDLQVCALNVQKAHQQAKICIENIGDAEKSLMSTQAQYLIEENDPPPGVNALRRRRLYADLDETIVAKYSLLQADDLLQDVSERFFDPEMRTTCDNICPKIRDNENEFLLPDPNFKLQIAENRIEPKGPTPKPPESDITALSAEPELILFNNYVTGQQYQKRLRIRNVTRKPQSFQILRAASPKFCITVLGTTQKLAPGISCDILVHFKTGNLIDADDCLKFVTAESSLSVKLLSRRDGPLLVAVAMDKPSIYSCLQEFRSDVECNFTVDCGPCFLGDYVEFAVKLCNSGNTGRFFLVSEDDWVHSELQDCYSELFLIVGNFIIMPNYFELEHNEELEIVVFYCPSQPALDIEKVYIMCDNSTRQELDLLGDCMEYTNEFISINLPIYPAIGPSDKVPKYVLRAGEAYKREHCAVAFIVRNNSLFALRYAWRKNDTESRSQGDWIELDDDCFDIYPNCGVFKPRSDNEFVIHFYLDAEVYGFYSNVLTLYIYDVPETSLEEGPYFVFDDEYLNEDRNIKLLSVMVDEIAVQLKYLPCPVSLVPDYVHFDSLSINEKVVVNKIYVKNYGNKTLHSDWNAVEINFKELFTYFCPRHFEISAKQAMECLLFVQPQTYDDLSRTYRLCTSKCQTDDFVLDVKVRKPKIKLSKTYHSFGIALKGERYKFDVVVSNSSAGNLSWFVWEHKFDAKRKKFRRIYEISTDVSFGALTQTKRRQNVVYTLNTKGAGKWYSMLVFYSVFENTVALSAILPVHADIKRASSIEAKPSLQTYEGSSNIIT